MIKIIKQVLSILLSTLLFFSIYSSGAPIINAGAESAYDNGDTIEFGSYPASLVTDNDLISSLDSIQKEFVSYKYYTGNGTAGSASISDCMKYADLEYFGERYRAVQITEYRPRQTYKETTAKNSFIDDNGYICGTTYYFKYEPIKWIILDNQTGLVLSEKIIDSQPYSEFMYASGNDINGTAFWLNEDDGIKANDYINTSVYTLLNNDFFTTAFTVDERSQISTAHLTNNSLNSSYQMYSSADSDDRVFLLSYEEAENSDYGFTADSVSSENRTASGTDYAKIQGLQIDESGDSPWWLRSAGNTSRNASFVNYSGFIGTGSIEYTDKGIRPAIILTSILPQRNHSVTFDYNGGSGEETIREVAYGESIGNLPATSKDDSVFDGWFTSKEGGIRITEDEIVKADITVFAQWSVCEHNYIITDSRESTCQDAGYKTFICSKCGKTYTEITQMKDHTIVTDPAVSPTCTGNGLTEGSHCSVCGTVIVAQQSIPADSDAHKDNDDNGMCDICGALTDQAKYDEYLRKKQAAETASKVNLKIKEPSVNTVNYGHTLILHAEYSGNLPDGYSIKWIYSGSGFEKTNKGDTYHIKSTENGTAKVSIKLVDPEGNTVKNTSGKEISDSKEITSKAGFFQKIVYFFKNLFKADMIIDD